MKVIIIGGGASGVFCALNIKANNPKVDVIILEQNDRILKKILKTGNGRCNIYNKNPRKEFYTDYSLLEGRCVDLQDIFKKFNILVKEEREGRMYPYSESSACLVTNLLDAISRLGIVCKTLEKVISVKCNNGNIIVTTNENNYSCDYLVFACGSNSQETTNGYELVSSLGHKVTTLSPALVAMDTLEETVSLKGIRVKAKGSVNGFTKTGELLFKEHGISGILTMDLSLFTNIGDVVSFDLMPDYSCKEIEGMSSCLKSAFPKMLFLEIDRRAKRQNCKYSQIIKNFTFTISRKKGFNESQITKGGVVLDEVNVDFSSKKKDNIYIIGELLDVSGTCGGYNLYFAWLSGYYSAMSIVEKLIVEKLKEN